MATPSRRERPAAFNGTYRLRALGASRVLRSTFEHSCGVIPDEIIDATVFPGGGVEGNVCFEIPSGDAGTLVLVDVGESFDAADRRFFALG
jgi:hypothetical protein